MKTITELPKVFTTKIIAEKALELGIGEKYVTRNEDDVKKYFETFGLEVIEGSFKGVPAKLEIASLNGVRLVAMAYCSGREMIVDSRDGIEALENELKKS